MYEKLDGYTYAKGHCDTKNNSRIKTQYPSGRSMPDVGNSILRAIRKVYGKFQPSGSPALWLERKLMCPDGHSLLDMIVSYHNTYHYIGLT